MFKKELKNAFEGLISEEAMNDILNDNSAPEPLKEKAIDYILISVKTTPLENAPNNIANVTESLLSHKVILESIFSALIIVTIGAHDSEEPSASKRNNIVEDILDKYGDIVSIVHGNTKALVGLYGSSERIVWGSIISNFSDICSTLTRLDYGEAVEVN